MYIYVGTHVHVSGSVVQSVYSVHAHEAQCVFISSDVAEELRTCIYAVAMYIYIATAFHSYIYCTCLYRTFWITSLAWSGDGLLLAAMTCRGSLLLMPRFGPPLKLVTNGCGLDMGPARLLPLHPLITVQ